MIHPFFHAPSLFLLHSLGKTPFWSLFTIAPYLLHRDFGATPLELTLFFALKPVTALFASYLSLLGQHLFRRLKTRILLFSFLSFAPFLFLPWYGNSSTFIVASVLYMLFSRATVPAWMELLRRDIVHQKRERLFAFASNFSYLGGVVFPLIQGLLLDDYPNIATILFAGSSAFAILVYTPLFFYRETLVENKTIKSTFRLMEQLKSAKELLQERKDFAYFQLGFMFGGTALMLILPALPLLMDGFHLSYTQLSLATILAKGLGFAISSIYWSKLFCRMNILAFASLVAAIAMLFPLLLIASSLSLSLLYLSLAFFIYGLMQAGSEMSWHLSGIAFAGSNCSQLYTNINITQTGIRGLFVPFLASFIANQYSPLLCLWLATLLSAVAMFILRKGENRFGEPIQAIER